MINSDKGDKPFRKNFIHMADIAKQTKLSSIIYEESAEITISEFRTRDKIFRKLADSLSIKYYISVTEGARIASNKSSLVRKLIEFL